MRSINELQDLFQDYQERIKKALDMHEADYEVEDLNTISYIVEISRNYGFIKVYFSAVYDFDTEQFYRASLIGWEWL